MQIVITAGCRLPVAISRIHKRQADAWVDIVIGAFTPLPLDFTFLLFGAAAMVRTANSRKKKHEMKDFKVEE